MNYKDILKKASEHLYTLDGRVLDILDIKKPDDLSYAKHLTKVVSKISPLMGNMIEYSVVQTLNEENWLGKGRWKRQDPGFPDAVFDGQIQPQPGIEIKTWFPLATEITARFKDSISHFSDDQTLVAVVAWIPEYIIYGKPKILNVWIGSAKSLALARDIHYHKPPDYLVFEPEDTTLRTKNLQQTNTNGYKFQGDEKMFIKAKKEIKKMGVDILEFSPTKEYQDKMKIILNKYPYRLDTNFAKIDRIQHAGLEEFKKQVLNSELHGKKIVEWSKLLSNENTDIIELLKELL